MYISIDSPVLISRSIYFSLYIQIDLRPPMSPKYYPGYNVDLDSSAGKLTLLLVAHLTAKGRVAHPVEEIKKLPPQKLVSCTLSGYKHICGELVPSRH